MGEDDEIEDNTHFIHMPVRHDCEIGIELPKAMTREEAYRICQVVLAMVCTPEETTGPDLFSSLN